MMPRANNLAAATTALLPPRPANYCVIEAHATTSSAVFELRNFDWRNLHQASIVPPSHYIELTDIRAEGRYKASRCTPWQPLGKVRYHPAGNEFECRWYDDRQTTFMCAFDADLELGGGYRFDPLLLSKTHNLQNPYLYQLLCRAQQEVSNPGLVSDVVLEALSQEILNQWHSEFSRPVGAAKQRGAGLSQQQVEAIVAAVRDSRCAPSLPELAASLSMSVRHFSRLFKHSTGESVSVMCQRERLNRAKHLLQHSPHLIKQVAYLCGFETSAAFAKAFRTMTGVSPQQYRSEFAITFRNQ